MPNINAAGTKTLVASINGFVYPGGLNTMFTNPNITASIGVTSIWHNSWLCIDRGSRSGYFNGSYGIFLRLWFLNRFYLALWKHQLPPAGGVLRKCGGTVLP